MFAPIMYSQLKMSQDKAKLTEIILKLEDAIKSELVCKSKIKKYGEKCKFILM